MKNKIDKVRQIVFSVLEIEHIHDNHKIIKIEDETISTYDGIYPSIEIIYESSGNNLWLREQRGQLIHRIEKYTGLRHNTDFWLGVSHGY